MIWLHLKVIFIVQFFLALNKRLHLYLIVFIQLVLALHRRGHSHHLLGNPVRLLLVLVVDRTNGQLGLNDQRRSALHIDRAQVVAEQGGAGQLGGQCRAVQPQGSEWAWRLEALVP